MSKVQLFPLGFFFQIPRGCFSDLLPYGRKHHQLAGGCAKLFAQEHALVSNHSGKITKNACARLKVHVGFYYGSFSLRLVFVCLVGIVSGVNFGLVWGLFGIGLGFV